MSKRTLKIGVVFLALFGGLLTAYVLTARRAVVEANGTQAPRFEVDPMWPKPLPNHWVTGNIIGVSVDAQDHIWVVHRGASLERMESYSAR